MKLTLTLKFGNKKEREKEQTINTVGKMPVSGMFLPIPFPERSN